jgi:sec-independent protein translocase protein TatA
MMRFGEILLLLLVVMIFFGAGKLPNVMGDLGKGLRAFKDGMKDDSTAVTVKKDDTLPPATPMT